MVRARFFNLLVKATGKSVHESSAADVESLLDEIQQRYGDVVSRYLERCIILVNGKNVGYLAGRKTKLRDGDEVSLFPPVAGG